MVVREMAFERKNITVVAIGAHPDDIELGAGMRLADHIRTGDRVVGVICTDGEMGGDRGVRVKEAELAAKYLGLDDLHMLHYPDTNLPDFGTLKDSLERIIKEESPWYIYTHNDADTHQDHKAVASAARVAGRRVPNILLYKSPSTSHASIRPHVFHLGSEKDFGEKKKLIGIYRSQLEKPSGLDMRKIELESLFYATVVNVEKVVYAEPFCANHVILNSLGDYRD